MFKAYINLFFALLLFPVLSTYAQKVTFVNENGEGIRGVLITTDQGQNYLTNPLGVVHLNDNANQYVITHINYDKLILSTTELTPTVVLKEKVNALNEVVIGANKWEEEKKEVPQQIVEFDKKSIELNQPMTSADILSQSGEIFVQKSQLGGGSPMIRGFAANQVLLVVDGVRMNNAIYRNGNLQSIITIDPNTIEKAEVLFGPASVMYGSDALGGVMDFHTIQPQFSENDELLFFGEAKLSGNTAAKERSGHLQINLSKNKWAYFGAVSNTVFDDLSSGKNAPTDAYTFGWKTFTTYQNDHQDFVKANSDIYSQTPSGYQQWNTLQKLAFRPNKHLEMMYTFSFSNSSNIPRYDRLTELNDVIQEDGSKVGVTMEEIIDIQNNQLITSSGLTTPKFAEWYYGPQLWMMNNFRMKWKELDGIANGLSIIAGHQKIEESRYQRKFDDKDKLSDQVGLDLFHLNIDANKQLNNEWEIFYGVEGTMNFVASNAHTTNIETGEQKAAIPRYAGGGSEMHTYAAYFTTKKRWTEHLTMTAGLRYSQTLLNADYSDAVSQSLQLPYQDVSQNVGSLTGSLGLAYHSNNGWQLNTQISKGFKAPNIDDVAKVYNPAKDDLVVPNSNLKPTDVYSVDITIQKSYRNLQFGMTTFYSRLHNAMVRQEGTFNGKDSLIIDGEQYAVLMLQNTGTADIAGISSFVKYQFMQYFELGGNVTYTYGKDLQNNTSLRHVPPVFGQTKLAFKKKRWVANAVFDFSGGIAFEDLAPSEQGKPYLYSKNGSLSWWTLGVNSSYRINNYLQVIGGVDNLFDLNYRTYSSGINAPGRNFKLTVKGWF
ncbi:TonB-dependent receptor [Flammeovirga yaeyamensis]|uniref:TonB-dependent receptor n=1 Tax=Flammeovirga yaeyamensis TaxID=367791 RepID=A0AAX1NCX6_9BACT|nr:TonB-dependent receptor [Flammeovirga yaeyamensis]MBB3696591.1 hemoglobin/transferrin/lactoferrin receptor protein [Flammeovirga yaeyamensis]NMF33267.1 TonB-dependent receptor [Flammeovirga yaeyamensis]QWG05454.1 TonB-dependent receptor [Flammeovirga yaeyamensis]